MGSLLFAIIASVFAQQNLERAQRTQQADKLERKGNVLLRRNPAQFTGIDTIVSAIELGQELKEQLQGTTARSDILSLKDYRVNSPVLALRTAVHQVLAKNIVAGSRASFSPNDQLLLTNSGDGKSTVYDLSGKQLAQVAGSDPSFSLDS